MRLLELLKRLFGFKKEEVKIEEPKRPLRPPKTRPQRPKKPKRSRPMGRGMRRFLNQSKRTRVRERQLGFNWEVEIDER